MSQVTCDTWHLTCDMWHMTCDTWHVTVAPRGAYIFDRITSTYIHISIRLSVVQAEQIVYITIDMGWIYSCLYKNRGPAPSVEVIQDDYLKDICSPGSYGPNPGRIHFDRPTHCWSFSIFSLKFFFNQQHSFCNKSKSQFVTTPKLKLWLKLFMLLRHS